MELSKTILGKSMLFTRVPLVYAGDHNGSVQHGPLQTLVNGINVYKGV